MRGLCWCIAAVALTAVLVSLPGKHPTRTQEVGCRLSDGDGFVARGGAARAGAGPRWTCGLRDGVDATSRRRPRALLRPTGETSPPGERRTGRTGGFGADTRGGLDGRVIRVTTLEDRGPGSLRAAIEADGPRTVVFEVSGTIRLARSLVLDRPHVTIAGETAPSPGITVAHGTLKIRTHDVVVRHLRFRVGDRTRDGRPVSPRVARNLDAVSIENDRHGSRDVRNIVLDNISASWATDESVATWFPTADGVTLRDSIIAEPLHDSLHPKGKHSMGVLIGDGTARVAIVRNLIAHADARNPRLDRNARAVVLNNVIYNPGWAPIMTADPDVRATVIGNVLIPGPSSGPHIDALIKPHPKERSDDVFLYLRDNRHPGPAHKGYPASAVLAAPPVWHESHDGEILPVDRVLDVVLAYSGARPADRDAVDARVVEEVRRGTGAIIDSQDEVGGYPVLAENRRPLTLPANPQGDDDGDGATNLEEWLDGFRREVGEPL